nr:guanine nucleotide-binding protein subunit beta-like protein 1 [Lytechinus pictus]
MARRSPDPIFVLRGSNAPVSCVRFALDSSSYREHILSGCTSGHVTIWDLSTRRCVSSLDGHRGQGILTIEGMNNDQILSHGRDGYVHIWELAEGRYDIKTSITSATTNFCQTALWQKEGNGSLAVSGGQISEVRVISLDGHHEKAKLLPSDGHKPLGMPMCMKFIDETRLLIGYENGSVVVWNLSSCCIESENKLHQEPVMCTEYCSESNRGISGSSTDQLVSWSMTSQGEITLDKEITLTNPGVASLSLRDDKKILVSGGWDSRVRVWTWKKLKPLAVLNHHSETVNSLDFSSRTDSKGYLMAAGSKDTHISVWSLYNDPKT